jgi:Zn finger protein HypA/HybF involved in hydrogenase expression
MHEMSLASSILDAVHAEPARVTKVGLRIGEWSGVDTESLRFCLETLSAGAPIEFDIDFQPASPRLDIAYFEIEDDEKEQ